jgi:hypothetical protein
MRRKKINDRVRINKLGTIYDSKTGKLISPLTYHPNYWIVRLDIGEDVAFEEKEFCIIKRSLNVKPAALSVKIFETKSKRNLEKLPKRRLKRYDRYYEICRSRKQRVNAIKTLLSFKKKGIKQATIEKT